jgi:hypothetical protein
MSRERKAVVVAIRGTMSIADVVTDAVVHPEDINDWLPPKFSRVRCMSSAQFCHKPSAACVCWQSASLKFATLGLHGASQLAACGRSQPCCKTMNILLLSAVPQENEEEEGKAFGHAGIVAAASAVLADLDKGGILRVRARPCCPCP